MVDSAPRPRGLDLSSFKGNAPDQVLPAVTNDFLFHFLSLLVTAGTWMGDNFQKEGHHAPQDPALV